MPQSDILVVEDDAVLRGAYERKLVLSGFVVRGVETIQAAIDEVEKKAPDLMLLDLSLRDGSGFDFLRHFPRDKRTFPILIVSNAADDQHIEEAKKLGADDYCIKQQISMRGLLEKVQGMLKRE